MSVLGWSNPKMVCLPSGGLEAKSSAATITSFSFNEEFRNWIAHKTMSRRLTATVVLPVTVTVIVSVIVTVIMTITVTLQRPCNARAVTVQ